jgi:tetratricopeptide (TPR) repeat protein
MGKSKNRPAPQATAPAKHVSPQPAPKKKQSENGSAAAKSNKTNYIIMAGLAVITWVFYQAAIGAQFTNWDDPGYIRDNPLVKDLSMQGLINIFTTPIMGNYHPLTILSYAIEYSFVRLEPWLYHFDSVLLHIITTLLVYKLVSKLTGRPVAGAVTALLFGLHPMHVESVAWLAARKDVMYAVFYIGACLTYLNYIRQVGGKPRKWYILTIILFICSLLGKPVAVALPLTLMLIDYFEGKRIFTRAAQTTVATGEVQPAKKFNFSILIDKLAFFILAIVFGIKSVVDQGVFGALGTHTVKFNMLERLALGCYALVTYLWKAVVPADMSNFYPYPEKVNDSLPAIYYLNIAIVAALVFVVWRFARKNRYIIFGSLFFLANIALLLQFIPVGGAIVADRYTYIAYMGLFFIAGWYVSTFFEEGAKAQSRQIAVAVTAVYALCLGFFTNQRNQVWYDTNTLWMDEITKHPRTPNAYNNLGFEYFNKFNESVNPRERQVYFDSANYLLNKALELQSNFPNAVVSLGELNRSMGNFPKAKEYYYRALTFDDKNGQANAYLGLAIIYSISRNFDSAGYCFSQATTLKPYFPEAHSNFGNYYDMMGKNELSLKEYGMAISQNPDMYAPYLNRGRELHRLNRCEEAMNDFERALELKPDMGEIFYSRSYCYTHRGKKREALQDVEKAISLGFNQIDPAYYQMLKGGR